MATVSAKGSVTVSHVCGGNRYERNIRLAKAEEEMRKHGVIQVHSGNLAASGLLQASFRKMTLVKASGCLLQGRDHIRKTLKHFRKGPEAPTP